MRFFVEKEDNPLSPFMATGIRWFEEREGTIKEKIALANIHREGFLLPDQEG